MTIPTQSPPVIWETDGHALTREAAFERFKAALAAANISPSDRYRIHVAACVYASAAAQEMLTEFDAALRAPGRCARGEESDNA